jgi:hypothetical protein
MPKAASFSPLRLFTPIQLVFCLLLFFLPWIDLQCVLPAEQLKNASKQELERTRTETGWDPAKPFSYASQSGFQIATGDASPGSDLRRVLNKMKKSMGDAGGQLDTDPNWMGGQKKEGSTAPLLLLYPLAVFAGIIVGFILGPGTARRITLLSLCLGALAVVGLQAAIGFPIERHIKKLTDEERGMGLGGFGGFGGNRLGGGGAEKQSQPRVEDVLRVSWQIPLYLTFLLLLGAAGTSVLDGGAAPKSRRKSYDFDDDDDDDDDRPRRKKRRLDDDEPPRKHRPRKALSPDDVEDERPRQRRRRDDD